MNLTQRISTMLTRPFAIAVAFAFTLTACSQSAGGPQPARLQVSVFSNGASVVEPRCTRAPVLLGSRLQERVEVDETFAITINAEREQMHVALEGMNDAPSLSRTLDVDTLRDGYSEELDVVTLRGVSYVVDLSSICE